MPASALENGRHRCDAHASVVCLDLKEVRCSLCESLSEADEALSLKWSTGRNTHGVPSIVLENMPVFFRKVCRSLELRCEHDLYVRYDEAVRQRTDDSQVVGVHNGYLFGSAFESQFYSYAGITDEFFRGVRDVLRLECETAGYILSPVAQSSDEKEFLDEICVVKRGDTFDTTDRLGVDPVDRSPDLRMRSERDNNVLKWQVSTYHTHPIVTKLRLGRHAPPSFEDGACFLRALPNSSTHVVIGYSGMYTLRRLVSGEDRRPYDWSIVEKYLDRMARHAKHAGKMGEETKNKWCELQRSLMRSNEVSSDLLSRMRSMPFETLHDIHCYLIVYMHLFKYSLLVDFHPYKFRIP
ncbi:hypothetical protein CYMTET_2845 [Cymbomonas tetramitiformis]|uniref:Uncharacterized protein n=1 Tax=Cymbomonas tetramitiformis TaxID=36881 RepID=A0AAE0H672_9CHLO|nr:hypothetical protein CYMTET_2845 [Cymbomonas tetramitiformis]